MCFCFHLILFDILLYLLGLFTNNTQMSCFQYNFVNHITDHLTHTVTNWISFCCINCISMFTSNNTYYDSSLILRALNNLGIKP